MTRGYIGLSKKAVDNFLKPSDKEREKRENKEKWDRDHYVGGKRCRFEEDKNGIEIIT